MPRAADESLMERIRPIVSKHEDVSEKKMFGGLCIFVNGNMAVGTWNDSLVARLDKDKYDSYLEEPHTRAFDANGRPMKGWVAIDPKGIEKPKDLRKWVTRGIKFAQSLPSK